MDTAITARPNRNVGLVTVRTPAEVTAMRKEKEAGPPEPPKETLIGLAAELNKKWGRARQSAQPIQQRMMEGLRQRRGDYESSVLDSIREMGGSEIFLLMTDTKCRAASALLRDVLQGDDKPWGLDPTPVPSLPKEVDEALIGRLTFEADQLAAITGQMPSGSALMERKAQLDADVLKAFQAFARTKSEKHEHKIQDQFREGNFYKALEQVIDDIVTFPTAIMRGPVPRMRPKLKWAYKDSGNTSPVVQKMVQMEYDRVNPLDFYPSHNLTDPRKPGGWFFEHMRLSRADISAMRNVEGYSVEAINKMLEEHGAGGLKDWLWFDTERNAVENRPTWHENDDQMLDALWYWGSARGQDLIDWGVKVPDPLEEYEIDAMMIGKHIIRAVVNDHPLGMRPYGHASFENVPGAFWGRSPPELIKDLQQLCNAIARALTNNMGIGSGPMVGVNTKYMPPGTDITGLHPWKVFQFDSGDDQVRMDQMLHFFQPSMNIEPLMRVHQYFSDLAGDATGIPAYTHGNADVGSGAAKTASGLSMLMNSAAKGMKQVISNMDSGIFSPIVEMTYQWNMMYDPDPSIKGDAQVVARGASALIQREQLQMRRNEFLQTTANPIDLSITGKEGRARILREVAKTLDLPANIVPTDDQLRAQAAIEAQAMEAQTAAKTPGITSPGGTPTAPATLDAAGGEAGGRAINAFQRPTA